MVKRARKYKESGEAFKKLLKDKNFSQYKLEQVTGIDKSVISKIVNGYTAEPKLETLEKIATALGVELPQLTEIFTSSNTHSSHSSTNPQPQQLVSPVSTFKNPDFLGREKDIENLNNLVNQGAKVILIKAEGGIGKTTLAENWFKIQGLEYIKLNVGTTSQNLNSVEEWVRLKLKEYFKVNPANNFITMLEQLQTKLQEKQICIFIDNLEPALQNGEFIDTQKNYVDLLLMLADKKVNCITIITSREEIHEHKIFPILKNNSHNLEGLNQETWQEYFENKGIKIDNDSLNSMWQNYGGNALAMEILPANILQESQGDLKVYWQNNSEDLLRYRSLEQLVQSQFDKLRNDNLQAYQLLCRLGCYRYKYIDKIPEKGLFCLLWDEPSETIKRRIINNIKDRALLKCQDNRYYLLPVIYQEAMYRLRLNGECEKSNCEAVIFWSEFLAEISDIYQPKIPKIIYAQQVNNHQEQMYINIDNAEKSADSNLNKSENAVLEIIYHFGEFYSLNSFEEIRLHPKVADNLFAKIAIQMVFEYVECYKNLGISLYKYGLCTHILAICDETLCNFTESQKEFEYSKKSFTISQSFFNTALLIAHKVKDDKLVNEVFRSLAGIYYYRGISLHQLGIHLFKKQNYTDSKLAFQDSKTQFEKSLEIFKKIQENQKIEQVKQATKSLAISLTIFSTIYNQVE